MRMGGQRIRRRRHVKASHRAISVARSSYVIGLRHGDRLRSPREHPKEGWSVPHYDAIVIGSGQAGNPLSQKLADRGWAVALVEMDHLGGTCINTGCTPTKTMMASAQVAHYARNAGTWGVRTAGVRVDFPSVIARKDKMVSQWRSGLEAGIRKRPNLHVLRGHARFAGPHSIR